MVDGNARLWALRELKNANFGDERRGNRSREIITGLAAQVGIAISLSCGPGGAQAVSRFFNRKEVTVESILASHIEETVKRCKTTDMVIAIQDTTVLDFTSHKALEGTGPITTGSNSRGLLMHDIMVCDRNRIPLGLLGLHIWARNPEEFGISDKRKERPMEEKESNKWLWGLEETQKRVPPEIPVVAVCDCEGDIYGLFAAPRRENCNLLVRSYQNRLVDDKEHGKLEEVIESQEAYGEHHISVPVSPQRKKGQATLAVKGCKVRIKRPANQNKVIAEPVVEMYCVRATEINVPAGVEEPIEWTLLTTLPVTTLAEAVEILELYSCRWLIEEFHRVLKSGCKVERLQMESLNSLLPAIALSSVVAWRVLYMSKYGRVYPDAGAEAVCTARERMVLERWMRSERKRSVTIVTVQDFVRAVAMVGGFMGRKGDKEPGTKTLWQGLRRLDDLMIGFALAEEGR